MKEKLINVTLQPDGRVEIAPSGVKGKECINFTKFLEDALGMEDGPRKFTPEYEERERINLTQRT